MTSLLDMIIPPHLQGVVASLYFGGCLLAVAVLLARNVSDEEEEDAPIEIDLGDLM